MIDYTLEEDLPQEFRGGKLTLNSNIANDTKSTGDNPNKLDTANSKDSSSKLSSSSNCYWGSTFISPLTAIPNKITESLWNKKPEATAAANPENAIQPAIPIIENPNNFFTFRDNVIETAIKECNENFLDPDSDGPLIASFLLTMINHWDSDKERLILLTPKSLIIAKYDFIALRRLGYKKLPLDIIEEVIIGNLVYPQGSLIPRINGFADGVSNILENCLFSHWSNGDNQQQQNGFYPPRDRNMKGLRLIWNSGKPLNFSGKWNPFSEDVPFCTFTYHPLFFHKDWDNEKQKNIYDLEMFAEILCDAVVSLRQSSAESDQPIVHHQNIILQNYIGLGSLIHNRNSLGFFKVRGKFSF